MLCVRLAYGGALYTVPLDHITRYEVVPCHPEDEPNPLPQAMHDAFNSLGKLVHITTLRGDFDGIWRFSGMERRFSKDHFRFSRGGESLSLSHTGLLSLCEKPAK